MITLSNGGIAYDDVKITEGACAIPGKNHKIFFSFYFYNVLQYFGIVDKILS